MASLGWTGPDVWYAHGIHFNDEELRELARTGTGVAHCPISNMKPVSYTHLDVYKRQTSGCTASG